MTEQNDDNKHILTIDEMLGSDDTEYALIPTWKFKNAKGELEQGYTRIGSLDMEAIAEWRDENEGPAKKSMGIRLFVRSLVDEKNNRIGTPKHYEAFKKKSNSIQERVLAEIVKLNGMTVKQDADAKKS